MGMLGERSRSAQIASKIEDLFVAQLLMTEGVEGRSSSNWNILILMIDRSEELCEQSTKS